MGEVFDKVGKRMGLPYPQGPLVDEVAEKGDPEPYRLPVARCSDQSLDFSFSGLKTRTLEEIESLERKGLDFGAEQEDGSELPTAAADLLAGFRVAAVAQILDRLEQLYRARAPELLAVSGGVAANRLLRRELETWAAARSVDLRLVPLVYSGDNAAMIAHAALLRHRHAPADDPLATEAESRIPL